jgi:GNAT superfamily N-acetyltransferase
MSVHRTGRSSSGSSARAREKIKPPPWRRPHIALEIVRVTTDAWSIFKHYHYLTSSIHRGAVCFAALYEGRAVAFDAWLPFVGKLKDDRKARRGHRTVCLPDYQGVGIGAALFNRNASLWAGLGYRVFSCTGHPAEICARLKSGLWVMTRKPGFTAADTGKRAGYTRANDRLSASFEYIGPAMNRAEADKCLNG